MALSLVFTITEKSDASSLKFIDVTGDYNALTNTGGWGTPNTGRSEVTIFQIQLTFDGTLYTYDLPSVDEADIISLQYGIDLEPSDFGISEFADGIYQFEVLVNAILSEPIVEGFAAIVSDKVYKDNLNYRLYLDQSNKSRILEQSRLLDNLISASNVGSTNFFEENLQYLENILP